MRTIDEIKDFTREDFVELLNNLNDEIREEIVRRAAKLRDDVYGKEVYTRGLIEFTNYCKNNCYYCGIRKGNTRVSRYRLTKEEILESCRTGYSLGYRTFVLQGGEDDYFTDEILIDIIRAMSNEFPQCAITLSIGERSEESYRKLFAAGVDRYLLREESSNEAHYRKLHPPQMKISERKRCLEALKRIGFQTGAGFMVGSPFQTNEHIAEDLVFLRELKPEMVGIGPFIPQKDTPFGDQQAGSVELTVTLVAIIRLLLPDALIPATTAVGTLDDQGREKAVKAGANVVMPNLSPLGVRDKYILYDNKICTGDEAAECRKCIEGRIRRAGYNLNNSRGDHIRWWESENGCRESEKAFRESENGCRKSENSQEVTI